MSDAVTFPTEFEIDRGRLIFGRYFDLSGVTPETASACPACSIGQFAQAAGLRPEAVTVPGTAQRQVLLDFLQYGSADVFQQIYKANDAIGRTYNDKRRELHEAVIVRAFSYVGVTATFVGEYTE